MTTKPPVSAEDLHQSAEELFLASESLIPETTSPEEITQLLHELRVHQIELEMQNDELRRAQADLDASQARYFYLYDLAPAGYMAINSKNLIQEVNLAAATMLGVARSVLVKEGVSRILPRESQLIFYQYLKQCIETSAAQEWEMRLLRADGEPFWAHLQVTQGQNGEYWLVINDITERKKAEVAFLKSQSLLAETGRIGKVGGWEFDIDTGKLIWTEEVYRIHEVDLNYDPNVGKGIDFYTPTSRPIIKQAVKQAIEYGEPFDLELEIITAKGNLRNVHAIGRADLEHRRVHGFFQDITEHRRSEEERKILEQQFQQTQKLESLGVLSGGIAHDFNNILTIIMGYCSLTKMDYETAEKNIPEIEKAAERAAGLCRQMLVYAGKAQLSMEQVNMWMLADEMVSMLKATLPHNALIKADLSTDIPFITADASQLRQIVLNLIINASEAIGTEQGEIGVSLIKIAIISGKSDRDHQGKTIPPGEYVCLEVTDTGCGMDEETKLRIFEPFYTTKFTGRGLGMSAVLGIITSHNGALQLFSQLGQGTTFKVYLPVPTSDTAVKKCQIQSTPEVPWQGSGTILLVEDEAQIRFLAKSMLEMFGFTVIEAVNGKEALELYQKNAAEIRMVLTDMGMPVMNGYALVPALKQLNPQLPVIISSGFGDMDVFGKIGSDNIAGVIGKPYKCSVAGGVEGGCGGRKTKVMLETVFTEL